MVCHRLHHKAIASRNILTRSEYIGLDIVLDIELDIERHLNTFEHVTFDYSERPDYHIAVYSCQFPR